VDRSDFAYLSRKLQGYRIRRDEHTWSVDRVEMADGGRLSLDIGGEVNRSLAIDLPGEFNPRDSQDLAWLLGLIEHSLAES